MVLRESDLTPSPFDSIYMIEAIVKKGGRAINIRWLTSGVVDVDAVPRSRGGKGNGKGKFKCKGQSKGKGQRDKTRDASEDQKLGQPRRCICHLYVCAGKGDDSTCHVSP